MLGSRVAKIGDVRPQNIFISERGGKIKLANSYSWPGEANSQSKTLEGIVTYIPPEEIDNMRKGSKLTGPTSEDSEQFAIGLTVLSAGILRENSDLYDLRNMTFNMPEATKRMNFWLTRQKYS